MQVRQAHHIHARQVEASERFLCHRAGRQDPNGKSRLVRQGLRHHLGCCEVKPAPPADAQYCHPSVRLRGLGIRLLRGPTSLL
jgi:hypothetical protein